ncbi:Mitochondrial ribosomal protein L27 precursor [Klebsormidium nitens]|uniref:Mitochondrial ribosomal protein L27 n=1 Tax=Klebsormidium nitens TaxID=105231 RepID=A0A1Y1I806_KLENI|nr:Mitochondrial ribosomal protein L27 precursor [Klebsormidium nitens]|eukprot:GAQ84238.1 Mitochondrial ribosomal protein L27 precursor [Klebsormidium nitens]
MSGLLLRFGSGWSSCTRLLPQSLGFPCLAGLTQASDSITQTSNSITQSFVRHASKKAGGSSSNGRDSNPKNLGLKKYGGQKVIPGNIIVRQRGTQFHQGNFVGMGKDHTLFALLEGKVRYHKDKMTGRKTVHVDPVNALLPVHPAFQGSKWEAALSQKGQQGIRQLLAEMKTAKKGISAQQ